MDIGSKIKETRTKKRMTLKELSQQSGLSIGFLSQLERGLTSVAVDSLETIAQILNMPITEFFEVPKEKDNFVLRSYDLKIMNMQDGEYVAYLLSGNIQNKFFLPKLVVVLPNKEDTETALYSHDGEEFIYVLEGVLTVYIENKSYELYPGDSAHFSSGIEHNWYNRTNKTAKILTVNAPNYLSEEKFHG